jgi:hypothetical protein
MMNATLAKIRMKIDVAKRKSRAISPHITASFTQKLKLA